MQSISRVPRYLRRRRGSHIFDPPFEHCYLLWCQVCSRAENCSLEYLVVVNQEQNEQNPKLPSVPLYCILPKERWPEVLEHRVHRNRLNVPEEVGDSKNRPVIPRVQVDKVFPYNVCVVRRFESQVRLDKLVLDLVREKWLVECDAIQISDQCNRESSNVLIIFPALKWTDIQLLNQLVDIIPNIVVIEDIAARFRFELLKTVDKVNNNERDAAVVKVQWLVEKSSRRHIFGLVSGFVKLSKLRGINVLLII